MKTVGLVLGNPTTRCRVAGEVITLKLRPMTPVRRAAALALLERAAARAAAMRKARGVRPFSSSTADVRAIRDAAGEDKEA
jgi:hypothetical protein